MRYAPAPVYASRPSGVPTGLPVGADIPQAAALAFGAAGVAHRPAVQHKTVTEIAALLGGDDLPQGHFHLFGLLDAIHQPNAVAQADACLLYTSRSCGVQGIRVSENCAELRGAKMDMFQAAEMTRLLGIEIL